MAQQSVENERADVMHKIDKIEEEKKRNSSQNEQPQIKRQKIDDTASTANVTIKSYKNQQPSEWDKHEVGDIKQAMKESTRISSKWDTPKRTPSMMDGTTPRRNRWDLTPSG